MAMPPPLRLLSAHLAGLRGQVLASARYRGEGQGEGASLSAAVEALARFLPDVDPLLTDGGPLVLDQGGFRILAERGRSCSLILLIEGREDPSLRAALRDTLNGLEARFASSLSDGGLGAAARRRVEESLDRLGSAVQVF